MRYTTTLNFSKHEYTATCRLLLNKGENIVNISSKRYVSVTTPSPELCVLASRGPWTRIDTSPFPVPVLALGKVYSTRSEWFYDRNVKIRLPYANNSDLKIRRRRRQRERHKTNRFNKQTTTFYVHHTFLYISLPFLHDDDVKMPHFMFYTGRKQAKTKFSFSFITWIRQLGIQP